MYKKCNQRNTGFLIPIQILQTPGSKRTLFMTQLNLGWSYFAQDEEESSSSHADDDEKTTGQKTETDTEQKGEKRARSREEKLPPPTRITFKTTPHQTGVNIRFVR